MMEETSPNLLHKGTTGYIVVPMKNVISVFLIGLSILYTVFGTILFFTFKFAKRQPVTPSDYSIKIVGSVTPVFNKKFNYVEYTLISDGINSYCLGNKITYVQLINKDKTEIYGKLENVGEDDPCFKSGLKKLEVIKYQTFDNRTILTGTLFLPGKRNGYSAIPRLNEQSGLSYEIKGKYLDVFYYLGEKLNITDPNSNYNKFRPLHVKLVGRIIYPENSFNGIFEVTSFEFLDDNALVKEVNALIEAYERQ